MIVYREGDLPKSLCVSVSDFLGGGGGGGCLCTVSCKLRNLKLATYLKFLTCGNPDKIMN